MKTSVLRFDELKVSGKALKELPAEHVAFAALLLSSVNEVNVLFRAYLANLGGVGEEALISSNAAFSQLFFARALSSKLFEAIEVFRGKKWNAASEQELIKFRKEAFIRFEEVSDAEGFEIAKKIRHESAHHYSLSAAMEAVKEIEDASNFTLWVHKMTGNQFSDFGEQVTFTQKFESDFFETGKNRDEILDIWMKWVISVSAWLRDTSAQFYVQFIHSKTQTSVLRDRIYWLDNEYVSELGTERAALFLQESCQK